MSEQASEKSYNLRFVKRETGRTHTVDGGGRTVPIVHGETGEPEAEYALLATIDGVEVPLASYNAGRIETVVKAGQASQQAEQQQSQQAEQQSQQQPEQSQQQQQQPAPAE